MLNVSQAEQYRTWSRPVKVLVYFLVILNTLLFYFEESGAATALNLGIATLEEFYLLYPATIDTSAWVILVLSFELDTNIIGDDKLKGSIKWSGRILRYLCYFFIVTAFWGYLIDAVDFGYFKVVEISSACQLADGALVMTALNDYQNLSTQVCQELGSGIWLYNNQTDVYILEKLFHETHRLAWLDVINAGAWILICMVLEYDVRTQLKQRSEPILLQASRVIKGVLYVLVTAAAVYWTIFGSLLDGWDALIWIFAFMMIELNLYFWQSELQLKKERSFFRHTKF